MGVGLFMVLSTVPVGEISGIMLFVGVKYVVRRKVTQLG
jgi:hypothetical protein